MDITSSQIQEWLLEGAPARDVEECFARGPLWARPQSRLYYAECAAFPSPACVKMCLVPKTLDPSPGAAERQYDALIRVGRAMRDGAEFSVPRPFLLRADVGLLAMQWIPGQSMTRLLFNWRCGPADARRMMARAGHWLRHFHDGHEMAPGRFKTASKLRFVSERDRVGSVKDPVFSRALAQLRESARAAAAVKLSRSWIHGDFKTDNLIVAGSRTVGVDFDLRQEEPVIFDLATFLIHLELMLLTPLGWPLARFGARLRETFLQSYLDGSEEAIALPLAWLQLFKVLKRWSDSRADASWPLSVIMDFCFRRMASGLTHRIAQLRS